MSKLPLRGRPKAVAAGFWQLLNSPSTRKDITPPFLMKSTPRLMLAVLVTATAHQLFAQTPAKSHHRPHPWRPPGRHPTRTRSTQARLHRQAV
jgi:hypothetical protein